MNGTENSDLLLKIINSALKSKKLYPPGHPSIAAPVNKVFQLLSEALKTDNNVMIGILHETLVFDDNMIQDGDKLYPDILSYMGDKNIDALIFERGTSVKELSTAFDILSGPRLQGKELQRELHTKGVTHITLKSIPTGKRNALEIYNGAVEVVKNVMGEVRMGKLPKTEPVNNIIEEITETVLSDQNAIMGLTMIKNYDNYLYNHSVNVSIMAIALGRNMALDKEELHAVGVAALLHDVGKTGVAEDIIRKPGGLSSEEWEKLKEHPLLGSNIAKRMEGLEELIGRLIYEHHIKYDHSGYPQTTSSIHPLSQIITISDAYDALTTLRVYQQPHSPVEAIKVMNNFSGRHFNPDTLKAFVNMIGVYPVGTMVRLSSNEIGVVTKLNSEFPALPFVKVLYDMEGNSLEASFELDLSTSQDKAIVSTVNPATTTTDIGSFFEKEAANAV
ncbi:MAG: HD-GYP domain-containing protein [Deltaproteobacteria bacterium]|nr:HD-GYP domain-containing protein [Deltaproteobacteria bacterium]